MKRELLIGSGSARTKVLKIDGEDWSNLTTLDYNADHKPDVVWDLMQFPYPFEADSFDEIHAYEVLEHTGAQGDYKFFFRQFSELWRILKPGGILAAVSPSRHSPWAWGDPSHTRVLQKEQLPFLDQAQYATQVGKTPMSDFRYIYKADFMMISCEENQDSISFILQAVKPSRIEERSAPKPRGFITRYLKS